MSINKRINDIFNIARYDAGQKYNFETTYTRINECFAELLVKECAYLLNLPRVEKDIDIEQFLLDRLGLTKNPEDNNNLE
jgi:hypothetical protein